MADGKWTWNWKTGYRYRTEGVKSSNQERKKTTAGLGRFTGAEVRGPFKKKYVKNFLGQPAFYPPDSIDGIPILCRCRQISQYLRTPEGGRLLGATGAMLVGSNPPACWDDNETIFNPTGGDTYTVTIRHPDFYSLMASSQGTLGLLSMFFGGSRQCKSHQTRHRRSKAKKHTRKRRCSLC